VASSTKRGERRRSRRTWSSRYLTSRRCSTTHDRGEAGSLCEPLAREPEISRFRVIAGCPFLADTVATVFCAAACATLARRQSLHENDSTRCLRRRHGREAHGPTAPRIRNGSGIFSIRMLINPNRAAQTTRRSSRGFSRAGPAMLLSIAVRGRRRRAVSRRRSRAVAAHLPEVAHALRNGETSLRSCATNFDQMKNAATPRKHKISAVLRISGHGQEVLGVVSSGSDMPDHFSLPLRC
jgi:hypothetical protein